MNMPTGRGSIEQLRMVRQFVTGLSVIVLLGVAGTLSLSGCGGGGGGGVVPPTAAQLAAEGWSFFEAGDLDAALEAFAASIATDSTFADGWNGLGWAGAYHGDLPDAATAFARANDEGLANAEAWAGLSAVDRQIDPDAGLAAADSALTRDPDFIFTHDSAVTASDLHLLRAQIAVYLDLHDVAQAEADVLAPVNGLDPDSSTTWIVDGVTYPSYLQALVKLLEELAASIGGDLP